MVHSFHLTQALESFLDHRSNCGTAVCRAPSKLGSMKTSDFGITFLMSSGSKHIKMHLYVLNWWCVFASSHFQ